MQYFKFLRKDLTHHEFKYSLGLNIDTLPFNTYEDEECSPGGLYFTTAEHIWDFYEYGSTLGIVKIPESAQIKHFSNKSKASRIILTEIISDEDEILARIGKFMKSEEYPYLCLTAADYNHLQILKFAHAKGCEWDHNVCANAAFNGNFEILKYARENGCKWDIYVCLNAAFIGNLEILKYAHENGCDWGDADICSNAALNGHLEILKYARENGCEWNSQVCVNALLNDHLQILKYAYENGCEWDAKVCEVAAKSEFPEIIKYIGENVFFECS